MKAFVFIFSVIVSAFCFSCEKQNAEIAADKNMIIQVGDTVLMLSDVENSIPSGLSEEDSITMFNAIVQSWVKNELLSKMVDIPAADKMQIDRKVAEYRNALILERFLNSKGDDGNDVDERVIRKYYEDNKHEMKLDAPIVKGIFVKVSDLDSRIGDIRRWMMISSSNSIDNLEKYGLKRALQYEYFKDRWVNWSEIAEMIPYRFYDSDAFLNSTKDFETNYGGEVYFLHISDYLPSGSEIPFEYAKTKIKEILRREHRELYKKQLMKSLLDKAQKDNKIKFGLISRDSFLDNLIAN